MAVLRVSVVRLKETPKFLVSNNRDAEAVQVLQEIAAKYNRKCSLTLEQLEDCGEIESNDDYRKHLNLKGTILLMFKHLRILFATKNQQDQLVCCFSAGHVWEFLIHYICLSFQFI